MHGTQELAATVATSFLRVTLVPIIDLDVIQFAAETVTAATSAPAPDPAAPLHRPDGARLQHLIQVLVVTCES